MATPRRSPPVSSRPRRQERRRRAPLREAPAARGAAASCPRCSARDARERPSTATEETMSRVWTRVQLQRLRIAEHPLPGHDDPRASDLAHDLLPQSARKAGAAAAQPGCRPPLNVALTTRPASGWATARPRLRGRSHHRHRADDHHPALGIPARLTSESGTLLADHRELRLTVELDRRSAQSLEEE